MINREIILFATSIVFAIVGAASIIEHATYFASMVGLWNIPSVLSAMTSISATRVGTLLLSIFLLAGSIKLFLSTKDNEGVKKHWLKAVSILALAVLIGTGTAYYSVPEQHIGENERIAAESYNEMGFEMAEVMHNTEDEFENIVFSPLSIGLAYSMVYAGSEGETRQEFEEFLNMEVEEEEFHRSNLELLKTLQNPEPEYTYHRKFGLAKDLETNIANGIWFREDTSINEDYTEDMENYYQAEISEPPNLDEINSFVEDNTNGEIEEILENLHPNTIAVLVNAVYFYGDWTEQFDEEMTEEEDFYINDNSTVTVDMMEKEEEDLKYAYEVKGDPETLQEAEYNYQAVRLPYGETGRLGMYVFLPHDIENFVEEIDQKKFDEIKSEMSENEIDLKMPKYKAEYEADLANITSQMGLEKPYQSGADFSGATEEIDRIGEAVHKATVNVDEEGTEAAAATAVTMLESAPIRHEMIVNRPFMFVIADENSGSLMFKGIIQDPS